MEPQSITFPKDKAATGQSGPVCRKWVALCRTQNRHTHPPGVGSVGVLRGVEEPSRDSIQWAAHSQGRVGRKVPAAQLLILAAQGKRVFYGSISRLIGSHHGVKTVFLLGSGVTGNRE